MIPLDKFVSISSFYSIISLNFFTLPDLSCLQKALPRLTDREKILEIMDPALEGQYSMKEVIQVAAIAAMCVQPEADYRPLMADVVQSLVPLVKYNRSTPKISSSPSFHASRSPAFPDKVGD